MLKVSAIVIAVVLVTAAAGWLALRGPDIPYPVLEAKYTDSASRFVDLPGGFHVHYQDEGDPALPTLVLLHGFGDSFTSWEGWVPSLKGRFHVISVDFPGHGLTRAPAGYRLSGAGLADFVDAFASRLSLPRFAVAGNSMGGGAAWQLAVRHEKPPAEIPLAFRILQYPIGRAILRNIDNRPLIDAGLKTDVYDKSVITPALVARWADFQRAPGHRAILMDIDMRGQTQASADVLGAIKVPTLVLHGESDVLIEPASARRFAAAIAGAKLITYPHVGHLPQIEIPQRSAADAAEFLAAAEAGVKKDPG